MIKHEWRMTPWRKEKEPPLIATYDELDQLHTFRSVYGYPEKTQEYIANTGAVRGVKNFEVQSSTLYIDVDEEENVQEVQKTIDRLGAGYSRYDTGNRGAHWHIDTVSICHNWLPNSHLEFVRSIGILDLIDDTLYRHHSIIRCPGAVHAKTGKIKTLTNRVEGPVLEIPLVAPKEQAYEIIEEGNPEALLDFQRNLIQFRGEGKRHGHMFILFQSGIRAGLSSDEVLEYLYWWNSRQNPAHQEEAVLKKWKGFCGGQIKKTSTTNRAL